MKRCIVKGNGFKKRVAVRMGRIGVVIPTLNAGSQFHRLMDQIDTQTCSVTRKLVLDSSSDDDTREIARKHGFEVMLIPRNQFNHGGTRNRAFFYLKEQVDILIYITQDVQLADNSSFQRLAEALDGIAEAGAAYGRQLPQVGASPGARLQRLFNYPAEGFIKSFADKDRLGIKTAFLSNSFAAYRCSALVSIGGFSEVVACEDMCAGAKMLMKGYSIVYEPTARVYHSHEYNWRENFNRYYDTGAFHKQQPWIDQTFGSSEKEGIRMLQYQLKVAHQLGGWAVVIGLLWDNCIRYAAYRCGKLFG